MNDYKMTKQVKRKAKKATRFLRGLMIGFGVFFILCGIAIHQSFMLAGFLLVVLYYGYGIFSEKEYEYTMEDGQFMVDVIYGRKMRHQAHAFDLKDLEVVAPPYHEAVGKYRKDRGTVKLPKYDYTSYEDEIPYYTMIIMENREKIKILLDLDENMLQALKRRFPQKVYLE